MPQEKNHKSGFNANDFERYYSGKMSAQEKHALEKAALEDPFLGDAFEGYKFTPTPSRDIAELQARLLKKREGKLTWFKRKGPSQLLKIAAILILFAGIWWMSNKQNGDQPSEEIILADKTFGSEISSIPAQIPLKNDSAILAHTNVKMDTISGLKMRSNSAIIESGDSVRMSNDLAKAEKQHVVTQSAAPSQQSDDKTNDQLTSSVSAEATGLSLQVQNNIQGRVIDATGKPVTFATVMEKGNNSGMVVDNSGVFNYVSKDSISPLVINAEGYQARTVYVAPGKMQDLILKSENKYYSEKNVAAKDVEAKRKSQPATINVSELLPRVALKNATPAAGWDELSKYVNNNMNMQANANQIKGEVILRFEVNSRNEPTKIKIKKGLCNTCDAEAIRIIKSQSWQLTERGKKAEATVRF